MAVKTKDVQIAIRVTHDTNRKIIKFADKAGETKAAWIRKIIEKVIYDN